MIHPDKLTGRLGNRLFQIAYLYSQVRDKKIPDWYVQDPKYFEKYAGEIKEMFSEGIGFLPFVGVHVRRGDYVSNSFYVNLADSTDYYEKAMALFPGESFVIFSDDIGFCKKRFKGENIQYAEGGTELEDFNQLASCKAQIIANSSFSLWCGILNPNPAKRVIAPPENKYYTDGVIRTRYPKDFEQIDYDFVAKQKDN